MKKKVDKPTKDDFFVVGIGSSAGGLEALERFFKNVPKSSNLAYVVIPHLDPKHASLMPELLQKQSELEVVIISDGVELYPNKVYIVPPNKEVAVLNRVLQLLEPAKTPGIHMPIDFFFRSLAEDQGDRAICVIMSGMGTDGTLGLRAIKGRLGIVMAQSATTAKYKSMPQSAIDTGLVDFVLSPEEMPNQLATYVKSITKNGKSKLILSQEKIKDELQKIFILLRNQTGHDFSAYKTNTIIRRIERRMTIHQIETVSTYVKYLRENTPEIENLFNELLIGVTSFFRDPEAFSVIKNQILPQLLEDKPKDYVIRVWVPGCSTGEEAYSIAIILRECTEQLNRHFGIQVFGTDIDANAIEAARGGVYPASILPDVGLKRIKRFFVAEDNVFRIKKDIREMLIFAPQNLIKDPPFTKMDLVCCRNLLIYLDGSLQKKLIPLFHYSLKPGGALMLGTSETISGFTDLFNAADKKMKIYLKKDSPSTRFANVQLPLTTVTTEDIDPEVMKNKGLSFVQKVEKALLNEFAPPSVIINEDGHILYIHGRTGKYLEPAPGEARWNIFEMAREGINLELPAAVRRAKNSKEDIILNDLNVRINGGMQKIDLIIKQIEDAPSNNNLVVVFKDKFANAPETKTLKKTPMKKSTKGVDLLEKELQYTKESLQTTIEELETSNEELKSTNEELQSTNEELQSTNEELETSKEEQQSLNEELTTVNSELQGKIDELTSTSNDMKNLLDSINIPTIFLDNHLCIKRYTSFASKVINLIQTDIGRPVGDISTKLKATNIVEIAISVLNDLKYREKEVETVDGEWYQMRILPYRTGENMIDGVIIRFQELSERKEMEDKLKISEERLRLIQQMSEEGIFEIDVEGKIIFANDTFASMFGYSINEFTGTALLEFIHENDKKEWRNTNKKLLNGDTIKGKMLCVHKKGRKFNTYYHAGPIYRKDKLEGFIGTIKQIPS